MTKSYIYVFVSIFIVCLLLTSCQEDSNEGLNKELSIAEAKLVLANAESGNNLIIRIDSSSQRYILFFETGNPIAVKSQWIKKIEYDSTNWLATFYFQDKTSQSVNFLGELNINENDVVINPYLTSPLTALMEIITPVNGKFKVSVKGKPQNGITIEKKFDYFGGSHELFILGLYENYNNQVEFVFMDQQNKTRCAQIISIPVAPIANKPDLDIQILKNQLLPNYSGLYVVFNQKIGFDQSGEIRWYYNGDGVSFFCKLSNGNFISSSANNQSFYEVTMLGQLVKKYNVPDALHHEIVELPTGNFLVASHSPPGAPYEDVVVEISRSTGAVVKSWDFNLILDPQRPSLPDTQPGDWLHINAMYFDKSDNSFVISGRSQSAVVKIDYETGAIKWILGNHNYWTEPLLPFLLKPVDSNGNEIDVSAIDFWPEGQHAIQKAVNGNVLMYDNGDYRGFYDNPAALQISYTRIVEYKIDEALKTVQLYWQFDNNKTVFTKYTGYAQELPENNSRLAAYMWVTENTPKIQEISASDQVVFEATLKQSNAVYYRTYKVDVYKGVD